MNKLQAILVFSINYTVQLSDYNNRPPAVGVATFSHTSRHLEVWNCII